MKADRETFMEQIRILDRDALLSLVASLYDEMEEMRLKYLENERISTEAHIQFSELNSKYTAVLAENENLKKLLQKEVEKGLPVILAFHDPLFEQSLYDYHYSVSSEDCTYLVGCDEEHLLRYSEFRAVQQRPDAPTLRMIDYIKSEPQIKAILTGHLHFSFESMLTPTLPQFVTGGAYEGIARELTIE